MLILFLCIGMVDSFRLVFLYNLQNILYGGIKFFDEGNVILDFVYLKNILQSNYVYEKEIIDY